MVALWPPADSDQVLWLVGGNFECENSDKWAPGKSSDWETSRMEQSEPGPELSFGAKMEPQIPQVFGSGEAQQDAPGGWANPWPAVPLYRPA